MALLPRDGGGAWEQGQPEDLAWTMVEARAGLSGDFMATVAYGGLVVKLFRLLGIGGNDFRLEAVLMASCHPEARILNVSGGALVCASCGAVSIYPDGTRVRVMGAAYFPAFLAAWLEFHVDPMGAVLAGQDFMELVDVLSYDPAWPDGVNTWLHKVGPGGSRLG